jgi:WS/DGAT/MGAT family acyltransferase
MPERQMRFDARMSAAEALMWSAERDPVLRSSFLNVTFLDQTPDFDAFKRRIERAVVLIPRLRQRVVESAGGIGPPEWADDPWFDLDYHVRRLAVPAPGSDRQLLDLAALLSEDSFDTARPLWQLSIVEGLSDGRAAFLSKMHHTITDGVGGVRLSAMFLDLARDQGDPEPLPVPPDDGDGAGAGHDGAPAGDQTVFGTVGKVAAEAVRQLVGTGRAMVDAAGSLGGSIGGPGDAVETARSLARQLLVSEGAHSPLWAGKRSMKRQFEVLRVSLPDTKRAAKVLAGTVNDVFVAAIAGGAGAYHREKGQPVDELRMSMPVSTRSDGSAGGNSFTPTRVLVPVGIDDAMERFAAIHERLSTTKAERAVALADSMAGVLTSLPSPLLVRLARQQVETVDFATSNVRGAPFDLFVAGALILSNHPMGPTAGTAFNATTLSYKDSLDIGLNIDVGAVDDPGLLRRCIEEAFAELLAVAS